MSQPRVTLANDTVVPLDREDYAADRATMLAALDAVGAQRVYEIGSVGAPGISDLDLVAVFPDDARLGDSDRTVHEALAATRRTFLHAPWAIHARHLPRLGSLFAIRQMRELHDGRQLVVTQTPDERRIWNIEATASVLALLLGRRRVTTRSALCLLNGLRYNLELAAEDRISSPAGPQFAAAILGLRQDWFRLSPPDREARLVAAWATGAMVAEDLLAGYGDWLATHTAGPAGELLLRIPGTHHTYHFGGRPKARGLLTSPLANVVLLPGSLGPLFAHLAAPGCGLDRWLQPVAVDDRPIPLLDPGLATAVHRYTHATADYLTAMLAHPAPYLLLGGGTLAAVRTTPLGRAGRFLQRLGRRLLPIRS